MKKIALTLLLATIVEHAPFRLAALFAESFVVTPGLTHLSVQTDRYWDALALEGRLVNLGWTVAYRSPILLNDEPVYGLTDRDTHAIVIDAALRWNERYRVLAHEAGHALEPWYLATYGEREAFAESVGALLVGDPLREHARYLRRYHSAFLYIALTEWRNVYRAADFLRGES